MRDLTGRTFNRLTVLSLDSYHNYTSIWKCRCVCGNITKVYGNNLQRGHTRSCGCLAHEATITRFTTHGMYGTKEYRVWQGMKRRCYDKTSGSYERYGAAGVGVCSRWLKSFDNFYADMGRCPEGLTLERRNNKIGYRPSNCYWASYHVQANNRSSVVYFKHRGELKPITHWAKETGIDRSTILRRIRLGLPNYLILAPVPIPKHWRRLPMARMDAEGQPDL